MCVSGEITRHAGLHNLSEAFEDLLQLHDNPAAFAGHHGDGVGIVAVKNHDSGLLNHHGSGVPAEPQPGDCLAREVTETEFEAFKWKCSLHKMPKPAIKDMALKLDDEVLAKSLRAFETPHGAISN